MVTPGHIPAGGSSVPPAVPASVPLPEYVALPSGRHQPRLASAADQLSGLWQVGGCFTCKMGWRCWPQSSAPNLVTGALRPAGPSWASASACSSDTAPPSWLLCPSAWALGEIMVKKRGDVYLPNENPLALLTRGLESSLVWRWGRIMGSLAASDCPLAAGSRPCRHDEAA